MLKVPGNSNTLYAVFSLFFLSLSINGFAETYYVSSTGSDTSPGNSIAGAWGTINKVNSFVFLPGDIIYFEGGQTFAGNIFLDAGDANDPDRPVTISSYGTGRATISAGTSYGFYALNTQGFAISNLIFDGISAFTNTDAGIKIFSNLTGDVKFRTVSISNVEIKNFGGEGIKIYTSNNLTGFEDVTLSNLSVHNVTKNGIIVFGYLTQSLVGWQHKNVTISDCEVYNVPGSLVPAPMEGSGIVMEGVDGGVIQRCVAHDNGQNNTLCGGPGGIWSLESTNITIQYCESYRNHSGKTGGCDGVGFDLDGGVTNSFLQYNYSHDNDGAGYLLGQFNNARSWSNNTVRYNISENDAVTNEGGIGLFKGASTIMDGVNIYNNTIYVSPQSANNKECGAYLQDWNTGIDHAAFYNNIFITTGGVPLLNIPIGYDADFAGNIYWTSGSPFSIIYHGNTYTSLTSWRSATGKEVVNSVNTGMNSDPQLTNTGAGGTIGFGNSLLSLNAYKIQGISSPAYHAALDLTALYAINTGGKDFWQTILPGSNAIDIGSNQFVSILPVKLLGFHGACSGSEQNIFWATAEETNMKSFELMYSVGGTDFSRLGEISPKGSQSTYSFINTLTSSGNNYYQLRMTDLDGSVTHSPILNIRCETITDKITVWPNPFSSSIQVSINALKPATAGMVLYDALGKILLQKNVQLREGSNAVGFVGLDKLPSGSYYLQITYLEKVEHFNLIKAGK